MDKNKKLDTLFEAVRTQESTTSFEQAKGAFLNSLTAAGTVKTTRRWLTIKNGIIMVSIIGIISSLVFIFVGEGDRESDISVQAQNTPKSEHTTIEQKEKKEVKNVVSSMTTKEFSPRKINEFNEELSAPILMPKGAEEEPFIQSAEGTIGTESQRKSRTYEGIPEEFRFPKLTEEEIKKNHKTKKKMLKMLAKHDDNSYVYIPAGSFSYQGTIVSVMSFFMQSTEVSNLQYRTFLFDLLIQGKKEEFKKAAPHQWKWTDLGDEMKYMQDEYFSDEKYDHHPVANVSREGAEMYCKWLSEEVRLFNGGKYTYFNDVRLPQRLEWIKAASVEGEFVNHAWGDYGMFNSEGCFLGNVNMNEFRDITMTKKCTPKGTTAAKTSAGYVLGDDEILTGVYSYHPNEYGLYNMSGNLAEMVYDNGSLNTSDLIQFGFEPGTAGGGWMDSAEELKISANDKYKGITEGHPNIGFRVVMTYLGKGIIGEKGE